MTTLSIPWTRVMGKANTWAWLAPLIVAAAVAVSAVYLLVTCAEGFVGYPLDDSWIHQVYARNIAQRGEFSFVPGVPSAGSTSPVWSLALALGYVLRAEPRVWAYGLGILALVAAGAVAFWHARDVLVGRRPGWAVWLALLVVAEWHLVWAAVSGMETLLFAVLALATLVVSTKRPVWLAALTALAIATRPDGLTLVPFVMLRLLLAHDLSWRAARRPLLLYAAVLALGVAPYFGLNLALNGSLLPNTLAAKDLTFAVYRAMPLWNRLFWICVGVSQCEPGVFVQPWVGGQILLLPGLVAYIWRRIQRRDWLGLVPLAWALTFLAAYTARSPIVFQHGRYQMPVIPVLIVVAALGLAEVATLDSPNMLRRLVSRLWVASTTVTVLAFIVVGARAYMHDVAFIETEMVAASFWLRDNTPADAIIGAHDIGAVGYFGGRRVRDMAGLVDPEVIPFLTDEARISAWLDSVGVDYVMTFPNFFPEIVAQHADDVIYVSPYDYTTQIGYEKTLILRWGKDIAP